MYLLVIYKGERENNHLPNAHINNRIYQAKQTFGSCLMLEG